MIAVVYISIHITTYIKIELVSNRIGQNAILCGIAMKLWYGYLSTLPFQSIMTNTHTHSTHKYT